MPTLTQTIRKAIQTSGLSLNGLGDKADVDPGQISRFMRGERSMTLTTVEALLDALNLQVRLVRRKGAR